MRFRPLQGSADLATLEVNAVERKREGERAVSLSDSVAKIARSTNALTLGGCEFGARDLIDASHWNVKELNVFGDGRVMDLTHLQAFSQIARLVVGGTLYETRFEASLHALGVALSGMRCLNELEVTEYAAQNGGAVDLCWVVIDKCPRLSSARISVGRADRTSRTICVGVMGMACLDDMHIAFNAGI